MAAREPKYPAQITQDEHENESAPFTKRVLLYGWDSTGLQKVRLKVDADGILETSGAGGGGAGTEYAEGATDATITGTAIMWEDTSDTLRAVSAAKPLPVNIISGAGSGGTAMADDAAFTVGTTSVTPVAGTYKSTRDSVDDNDAGALAMTAKRALFTTLETPNGDSLVEEDHDTVKTAIYANGSAVSIINAGADDQDAGSNQLVTAGFNYVYDGTTWDRARGDATNGLLVNLGSNNDVTVTGTVAVTQSGTWDEVGINDSGNSITVDNVGTFAVQATIASGTTSIAKAEDVASADADVGVPAMAVRKATPANTSGTDGDYEMLQMSAGRLWTSAAIDTALPAGTNAIGKLAANTGVTIGAVEVAASQTLATVTTVGTVTNITNQGHIADDAAFTPATTRVMMAGFTFDDVSPDSVNEGDGGAARMSANRNIYTTIRDAAGNERGLNIDASGQIAVTLASAQTLATVTNVATIGTSITPGTSAAHLGKAEDAAHAPGDTGVAILGRRIDTAASSAGTSGDYATVDTSAEGAVWATLTPTTTSGCTPFKTIDLDETEEEVKATAGNVYGYYFANTSASARYLKWYNATAANVTVGTTTPVITMYLPPTSAGHVGLPYPIGFTTAITVAATTGVADNDTGAPGANEVIFDAFYK